MATKKKFRVTRGGAHISVYPYRHSSGREYWRFAWRKHTGEPWITVQKTKKDDASAAAWQILGEIQNGHVEWAEISETRRRWLMDIHKAASDEDEAALLAFLESRKKSSDLAAGVARFISSKVEAKGWKSDHVAQIERDLLSLAAAFEGRRILDIGVSELSAWWQSRTGAAGRERRKGIRGTLVQFWGWAQKEGMAGNDPVTVAERLPSISLAGGKLRIYSVEELRFLLGNAKGPFVAAFAIGAFAGIRPEEIAPKAPKEGQPAKPRLLWDHFDWKFSVIRIPAEVTKTGRARIVPILPALREWLEWIGAKPTWRGAVCLENPADAGETLRLGRLMDTEFKREEGWPKDALRHSYGSNRNAVIRNLAQVAEEMGTSEAMLHRHYHSPRTEEEGVEWFGIRPRDCYDLLRFG